MKEICEKEIVQINLSLPRHDRDMLRKIAAMRMMDDPSKVESAASVGSEIIRKYLDEQERRASKERRGE
jgi:hypothetical protein